MRAMAIAAQSLVRELTERPGVWPSAFISRLAESGMAAFPSPGHLGGRRWRKPSNYPGQALIPLLQDTLNSLFDVLGRRCMADVRSLLRYQSAWPSPVCARDAAPPWAFPPCRCTQLPHFARCHLRLTCCRVHGLSLI